MTSETPSVPLAPPDDARDSPPVCSGVGGAFRCVGLLFRGAVFAALATSLAVFTALPAATYAQDGEREGTLMLEEGRRLVKEGRPADALPFYGQALDMAEVHLGSDSAALGLLLHELGTVFREAGDSGRAEEQFRRALTILEGALGPEHPELLPALADLAHLVAQGEEPAQAQVLYQRLVSLLRRTREAGDADIVSALGQLALSLDQQQRTDEAEALYRQALAEADVQRQESLELATVANNLAALLFRRGELSEAEALFRRAADLRSRLLSPRHWLVAVSLSDLARVLAETGDDAEALDLATRAAGGLAPYCRGLSAQAPGESRSVQELCRETEALRRRLQTPPAAQTEPTPQSVGVKPPEGAPEGDTFRAQIVSRETLELARRELRQVRQRWGDLLRDMPAHLESIDLGAKGIWHRVQFGDFTDRRGASELCANLLARGWGECLVVRSVAP